MRLQINQQFNSNKQWKYELELEEEIKLEK